MTPSEIRPILRRVAAPIRELHPQGRLFGLLISGCAALVLMEYGITRPAAESLFISVHGSAALPKAWAAIAVTALLATVIFNRLISQLPYQWVFVGTGLFVGCTNLFISQSLSAVPSLAFFLYVWKDVYILLLIEQLWAVINSTYSTRTAKSLYGFVTGVGAIGSISGNQISRTLAERLGTENLLVLSLPLFVLIGALFFWASRVRRRIPIAETDRTHRIDPATFSDKSGFRLLIGAPLLVSILALVCFMQVSTALVDFNYKRFVELSIELKDARTTYLAGVLQFVNATSAVLQFIVAAPFIHYLGIKLTHLSIPAFLATTVGWFFLFPALPVISIAFVSIKAIDYSIFRIAKEILYIPASVEEKYKTKAVIDVFAYRGTKILSSVAILSLGTLSGASLPRMLSAAILVVMVVWMAAIPKAIRHYRHRLTATMELARAESSNHAKL